MSLSLPDIAATIRKHSPGALSESAVVGKTKLRMEYSKTVEADGTTERLFCIMPDDIAEAVLRDAMVEDQHLTRGDGYWCIKGERGFYDADHGGSLGACYSAWRWSKGIACDTPPSA